MRDALVDLAFWSPGDPATARVDTLLTRPDAPLSRHGLAGIAAMYASVTGATLHAEHAEAADEATVKSLAADGALTEVVPALRAEGIDFFVAKGPVLAYLCYPDPRLRPYTDLDVYVPAGSLAGARSALASLGYEQVPQTPGPLGGLGRELHGGGYGAVVEVHDHPIDNFQRRWLPPIEAFLPHVEHAPIAGVSVPVLSPPAHVALQAIHLGAGHRYQKLVLYRDLLMAGCRLEDADATDLGAGVYLATIAAVLRGFGVEVPCGVRRGVLHGPLVRSLVSRGPYRWDEYAPAARNVLAVANQPLWGRAVAAGITSVRAAVPHRGRRVTAFGPSPSAVAALPAR